MDKIELKLGDTIFVDGNEYVIRHLAALQDAQGRSVTIHAVDPLIAAQMAYEQESKKATLAAQLLLSKTNMIGKMNKILDEQHEHGPE